MHWAGALAALLTAAGQVPSLPEPAATAAAPGVPPTGIDKPAPTPPSSQTFDAEVKSPELALRYSLWGAVAVSAVGLIVGSLAGPSGPDGHVNGPLRAVGFSLFSLGLLVAPSFGHMYTRDWTRVGWFTGGRVLSGALVLSGVAMLVSASNQEPGHASDGLLQAGGLALGALGVAGLLTCVVWDIADSPASARRFNARNAPALTLLPLLAPAEGPSGSRGAALGILGAVAF